MLLLTRLQRASQKWNYKGLQKKKGTRELHQDTGGKEERMDKQQDI
jgi:hypothetical protein